MFDLKKRNSVNVTNSREAEEFRRVAVRRKVINTVEDCRDSDVRSGVSGSYTRERTHDVTRGLKAGYEAKYDKSSAKRPLFKPQVPPKPAHLLSPQRAEDQERSPFIGRVLTHQAKGKKPDQTPSRRSGASTSCVNLTEICLSAPTPLAPVSCLSNGVQISRSRRSQQRLESPSPGKRGSPLRDGGHSPAKLSPRNHSPLMGKLRTPSPVQARVGSAAPAKNSTSWLGLHGIPNDWTERQEKSVGKSLSVPDLIVYMDENRFPSENAERRTSESVHSPDADAVETPNEGHLSGGGEELSSGQMNGAAPSEDLQAVKSNRLSDKVEEDKHPIRRTARFSCQWTKSPAGDELIHEMSGGDRDEKSEENGGGGGGEEIQDEANTEEKIYKIANELLQTERAYVARLYLLDQVFCARLTEEAGRGSFPPEVIRNIFSNTSSIHSFHSQFLLPDLEKCICCWSETPGLGKVMLEHAPFLRMYADYVKNFDQAMELVRTWTERSSAFRNVVQEIQSWEVCGSLTLQHHMLEPVQRVPRYEMLLKDYLRKLPEENPDYQLAQKSLQIISMAATHSNSAIHKNECLKRLMEIYEMVGEEEVVNPTNEFLRQGRLLKLAARNASAMERHLFLFNNFLLCCSPRFSLVGQRFTVRCRIGVEGMHVQQTANEDHPYTFQVSGKEKILELQANSEQDRDEWIKVIQQAIDEFQKKNETFKLASKELNAEEKSEELGRRAPRWIRDNEVTLCMTCREPFNALTRRRHHCRACGFVVCWKCSDNKAPLEYDGNKLNKVCKDCYLILTAQRGERTDEKRRGTLESETAVASGDCVMSGFLHHGDNPATCQRLWSVLIRTEAPVLHLYALPKDVKPVFSVPLPGCHVDSSPPEQQGRPTFCLIRAKTSHVFSCESQELKRGWLAALRAACSPPASENSTAVINDIVAARGEEEEES
ncbi:unnamed protein product [Ophioblennius macclurei]